ncbi:homeobox-leucine zipper protein ATHB-54-like [Henckelia pumila]|uniref:homeobox-leucine zipper protein ATHB-54-like n=1 Tax=Henckelia pumila TaxID=405737 RepID=UPI003C6DF6D4
MDSRVYEDSHVKNVLLKKDERIHSTPEVLDSSWVPTSSSLIHGSTSMVNFEDVRGETKTEGSFFAPTDANEDYDGSFYQYEKKRRLLPNQVRSLEKCFDVDNKLEPDRKVQLAKELNLQPRQVAIWFQNRRARCKMKHIEREYDILKASYDKLKADYDTLYKENENLKNEVHLLKKPKLEAIYVRNQALMDVANSAKSDVLDPDSPHYTDGNHSGLLDPADSSHLLEPTDPSDFSQDEDDSLSRSLLLSSSCFQKLELEKHDDLQPNSCNLGFPIQDQGTWFWSY